MAKRQVGNIPLKSGDRLVLTINGEEQEGTVTRKRKHSVTAVGEFGQAVLKATGGKDGAELRIDIEQKDAEGRTLLTED